MVQSDKVRLFNRATRATAELSRLLPPASQWILDIGCGFGETLTELTNYNYRLVGVDIAQEALDRTRQSVPQASTMLASANQLPFPSEQFDAVTILDVLEHLPNPNLAIREATRVLKHGGILVITVPHAGWSQWLDPANLQARLTGQRADHKHYQDNEIRKLLGNQYQILRVEKRGYGLAQMARLVTYPVRKFIWRSGQHRIEQWLSYVESLEYRQQTGIWAYHLFVAAKRI